MFRVEHDPAYQRVLAELNKAIRQYQRALREMRRLYLANETPNRIQAALYQQIAHDAEHNIQEAFKAYSKFCWELAATGINDTEVVTKKRAEAIERSVHIKGANVIVDNMGRRRFFKE